MLCQDCDCSLLPIPHLWLGSSPAFTAPVLVLLRSPLGFLGQPKTKDSFLKVLWAELWFPRGQGEPEKVLEGWLGVKGKAAAEGNVSLGAVANCQGSLTAASFGLLPASPKYTLITMVKESVRLAVALRSTPAPVDGEDTSLQKDFLFLCFLWLWFNHGLWCFKYQMLIRSGRECVPKGPYSWSSHRS